MQQLQLEGSPGPNDGLNTHLVIFFVGLVMRKYLPNSMVYYRYLRV
jgi:hypothetical protein